MLQKHYETLRARMGEGHEHNPFAPLLHDRAAVTGPIQGTVREFSHVVYLLAKGDPGKTSDLVAHEVFPEEGAHTLKFADGSLFSVVRVKGTLVPWLIVVKPYAPSMGYLVNAQEQPLARLVFDTLGIADEYQRAADELRREERKLEAERSAEERRMARESTIETALGTIEDAKSGQTIMIRGLDNIDGLLRAGFVHGLIENPDNWIDADEFPGLRYRHAKSGIEVLLTGREKFRPIEELNRIELYFLVHRSDDDPAVFGRMQMKFRRTHEDGSPYTVKEFHDDLIAMAKYPEELQGRTEADLGLLADEVGHEIDRRQALDKGILPYEAVFKRDTQAIMDHVRTHRIPAAEIRKSLDYFEYTGMIDAAFKAQLNRQIRDGAAAGFEGDKLFADLFHDKRVKEIVAAVLQKLSRQELNVKTITIALSPYVAELGFGRLVKIRERILQLKDMVHKRDVEFGIRR